MLKNEEEIRKELNDKGGDWVRIPGFQSLSQADIADDSIKVSGNSIGLVSFFNNENAEIRFFIAKYIDTEANSKLT